MPTFTNKIKAMVLAGLAACAININAGEHTPLGTKVLQDGVYYQYVLDITNHDYTVWVVGYDDATLPADVKLKEKVRVPLDFDDPDYVRLKDVTGIADSAFMASSTLTTIEIPKTMKNIGMRAFADCQSLTLVNIGNPMIDTQIQLEKMDAYIFENCPGDLFEGLTINFYRFMPVHMDENALENAYSTIFMHVRKGSGRIWNMMTATERAELMEDIENIEDMFFVFEMNPDGETCTVRAATTDLPEEVVIPAYKYSDPDHYVTAIAPRGFENCIHLKSLLIPPSLETIGKMATCGCDSLTYIEFDANTLAWLNAEHLATQDGSVYSKDMTKLVLKPNATGLSLPSGVTELCDYSVPLIKGYSRITIPSGVKKIGKVAFWGKAPQNISLSNTVKELGTPFISTDSYLEAVTVDAANPYLTVVNNVIYSKDKTTVIGYGGGSKNGILTIEEGATKIRENAFTNSNKLRGLNLPASMEEIPDNFANDTFYLFGVYVAEENPFYASYNDELLLTKDMTRLIKAGTYQTRTKQPENVTKIEIPEGVTTIGKNAIRRSTTKLISLPETLKEIEDSAFYKCDDLMSISIPASVERIGNSAFENCLLLESVVIGSENSEETCALTSLGENVFAGCSNLTDVKVYSSEPPTAPESAFSNYNAMLTVAKGAKSDYQNAGPGQAWGNFASVSEHETMGIDNLTDNNMTEGNQIHLTIEEGSLKLSGYNGTTPVKVYTANGMTVYTGYADRIENLTPGIYIVAVGDQIAKAAVR